MTSKTLISTTFNEGKKMNNQPLFENINTIDKNLCREAGVAGAKKSGRTLALIIAGAVIMLLTPLAAWLDTKCDSSLIFSAFMFVGVFLLIFGFFFDNLIAESSYKNLDERRKKEQLKYAFYDDRIEISSDTESSVVKYEAVGSLVETPKAFALYIDKATAFMLPKDGFTSGKAEDFSSFIDKRTGKKVKKVKKTALPVKIIVCVVFIIYAMLASVFVHIATDPYASSVNLMQTDDYSIYLTPSFKQQEADDMDFYAKSSSVTVCAKQYSKADITEQYGFDDISLEEYANLYCNLNYDIEIELETDENGNYCCKSYGSYADGKEYYCRTCFNYGNGSFWVTKFLCDVDDEEYYAEIFEFWANLIIVAQETPAE